MRKGLLLTLALLLAGCTVETFYVPIEVKVGEPEAGEFLVIQNINPPYVCRVIHREEVYAAVYRRVFGPVSRREAEHWAGKVCRTIQP